MRLWSIPGLMSICILLTHSSRFVLSAGRNDILGQAWKSGSKTSKAPDGSQSSGSAAKLPQASGTTATHAQPSESKSNTSGTPGASVSQSAKPASSTTGTPSSQSTTAIQSLPKPTHTSTGIKSSTPDSASTLSSSEVNSNQIIPRKVVLPEQNLSGTNSSFPRFKVITEGSKEPNDTSKYYLKVTSDLIIYKFKYDSRCTELKFEDKSVWKFDQSKHKNNHPTYIFVHTNYKVIYIRLGDSIFTFSLEGQKWSGSEANLVSLDIVKNESAEGYNYSCNNNTGTYIAKDNFLLNEVIRKKGSLSLGSDLTLYQTKDHSQCAYKIVLDPLGSKDQKVTLHLVNGRVLTLSKENDFSYNPKSWIPFGPTELSIVIEGSKHPNDSSKFDIFNDHGIFDYVFRDNAKCTQVILKDDLIWELEDRKPSLKYLIYYRGETRLLLSFHDENIVFNKQDDKWFKITSKLIDIDIKSRKSTDRYKYNKIENSSVGSFEAIQGFGFKKVIEKKSGWNCFGSDKIVWEAENISEHSVKLLLDGLGNCESTREVQVYLANGDVLKHTKTGGCCGKQWTLLSTHLHTPQQI